jgi:hypothetical protein
MKHKKLVLLACLGSAAIGVLAVSWHLSQSKEMSALRLRSGPSEGTSTAIESLGEWELLPDSVLDPVLKGRVGMSSSNDELKYLEMRRFLLPDFIEPGIFKEENTPVVFAPSCASMSGESKFNNVTKHLQSQIRLRVGERFPSQGRIQRMTQYWSANDYFYSLGAHLDSTQGGNGYLLEGYVSDDANFSRNVKSLTIEGYQAGKKVQLEQAVAFLSQRFAEAEKGSPIKSGGRFLALTAQSPSGEVHSTQIFNGQVLRYSNSMTMCQFIEKENQIKCTCEQRAF